MDGHRVAGSAKKDHEQSWSLYSNFDRSINLRMIVLILRKALHREGVVIYMMNQSPRQGFSTSHDDCAVIISCRSTAADYWKQVASTVRTFHRDAGVTHHVFEESPLELKDIPAEEHLRSLALTLRLSGFFHDG